MTLPAGDLSLPIPVGANEVKLRRPEPSPWGQPGEWDGFTLVQIGSEAYDFRIGVEMALAVLRLAADHPELLARHDRARTAVMSA